MAWCSEKKPARMIRHVWDGFRRDSEKGVKRIHPTQKPVAVIREILAYLPEGVVWEPFLGSGSTILAADSLQRTCIGMEISPDYVAQTLVRVGRELGVTPALEGRLR
jgi:DNA modification methylase